MGSSSDAQVMTPIGPGSNALVTGASAGIGAAFAREFARRGLDLVLVARRKERLNALAQELEHTFGVAAHVLTADLADPGAPEAIFAKMDDMGLRIDVLLNNAGFGVPGTLNEPKWQRHRDCLEVMAVAPAHLSYLFAPAMVSRGRGWIGNVSSLSAFVSPHAGGTLYYPVKAFVLNFSLAHHEELRGSGVHVTAICPGFTYTEFQKAAGGSVESVSPPKFLWLEPDEVARAGYRALERGDAVCIPGRMNRLVAFAFKLMPEALGRWLVRNNQR